MRGEASKESGSGETARLVPGSTAERLSVLGTQGEADDIAAEAWSATIRLEANASVVALQHSSQQARADQEFAQAVRIGQVGVVVVVVCHCGRAALGEVGDPNVQITRTGAESCRKRVRSCEG